MNRPRFGFLRVGLLVDGENIPAWFFDDILRISNSLGELCHLSILGDLRSPRMVSWRDSETVSKLSACGGSIVNVCSHGVRNASDHALVVRASRLFFKDGYDTIAIASNDKGYAQIACQLRNEGGRIVGFGTLQPAPVFRAAFSDFFVVRPRAIEPSAPKPLAGVISRIVDGWAFVTVPRISPAPIACPLTRVGSRLGDVVRLLLRRVNDDGWRGEILETLAH